jgi:hypothetical protein
MAVTVAIIPAIDCLRKRYEYETARIIAIIKAIT